MPLYYFRYKSDGSYKQRYLAGKLAAKTAKEDPKNSNESPNNSVEDNE